MKTFSGKTALFHSYSVGCSWIVNCLMGNSQWKQKAQISLPENYTIYKKVIHDRFKGAFFLKISFWRVAHIYVFTHGVVLPPSGFDIIKIKFLSSGGPAGRGDQSDVTFWFCHELRIEIQDICNWNVSVFHLDQKLIIQAHFLQSFEIHNEVTQGLSTQKISTFFNMHFIIL